MHRRLYSGQTPSSAFEMRGKATSLNSAQLAAWVAKNRTESNRRAVGNEMDEVVFMLCYASARFWCVPACPQKTTKTRGALFSVCHGVSSGNAENERRSAAVKRCF